MSYVTSVVYLKGTSFNMDYYLSTHMPLVQKEWGPYGLKSWKVAKYTSPDAAYSVQAWLEWESQGHFEKAKASTSNDTVFADVPNFSDKGPELLAGEVVGSAVC
ncbi:hypothetical protein F5Y19DRAFT_473534 [Xylariaceae sp. FL1651]|nr:hypothetical protein F5Y19DRAFT_473534 [Xylariaceae sp. FL1651]